MRKYARLDGNHSQIVDVLRQCGCSVQSLASVGSGVPDLLVARNGKMWLMEIKDGELPPSQRRLTVDEENWHNSWNAEVYVVNNVDEALKVIQ